MGNEDVVGPVALLLEDSISLCHSHSSSTCTEIRDRIACETADQPSVK